MVHYVALIRQSTDREFTVSFPDLPGCTASGATPEAAIRAGTEALACHVEQRLADGQDVPSPRSLDQIRLDSAPTDDVIHDDATAVLVPLPPPEGRVVRLTLALPSALLDRIDDAANDRTGFLLEAAERLLAERERPARRGRVLMM